MGQAPRVVAMGDPQAPFAQVLDVLRAQGLLGPDGRLRSDVHLVSLGDHFDWGTRAERAQATDDALRLVEWLASHPPEQCTLLLGNHDLARVGELAPFDDAAWADAQALADRAYERGVVVDPAAERALLAAHPSLPTAECCARDYSAFKPTQRALVAELLSQGRFRLAAEHAGALLVHAGVTQAGLAAVGAEGLDAAGTAAALNALLDAAVARWDRRGPLGLEPWHVHGSAARGEATGALVHRPAANATGRRYLPSDTPAALLQVFGHVRDAKCRELFPAWCDAVPARDGVLRSMAIDAAGIRYRHGCAPDARLIFCDGAMSRAPAQAYELLDVALRQPWRP